MTERIVVMFAYHFPPENAIGGARPYRFFKYLSQMGYRCQVFTAAEQVNSSSPEIQFIPDPFANSRKRGIHWQTERLVRKVLFPGALGFQWGRLACKAARKFLFHRENAEITIYSSFPPLGAHLAALLLSRARPLKWIADFRDPLCLYPNHLGLNKLQHQAHGMLQRAIIARADSVIVNTDHLAEQWRRDYRTQQDQIQVIWNGFDPEDRIEEIPLPKRDYRLLSHVGALYGGRTIRPLLESISRLIDQGHIMGDSVRVRLVGPINSDCIPAVEFLERATGKGWLEIIPTKLSSPEARRMAQESDGLLLIQPHTAVQVPGKLFEYLRLNRPILALILQDTPIERILKQSGANYRCLYANSSPHDMDTALADFLNIDEFTSETNNWFSVNFDGRRQAEELASCIQSLHSLDPKAHKCP